MKTLKPLMVALIAAITFTSCTLEPLIQPDGTIKKRDTLDITIPVGNTDTTTNGNNGNTGSNGSNGNNGNTGSNGNTGTPTGTSNSTSYFPMTNGSVWKYTTYDGISNDSITVTMTDKQSTIDGKSYLTAELSKTFGLAGNDHYNYSNNIYYWAANDYLTDGSAHLPVLKDDVAVNGTWIGAMQSPMAGATVRYLATLKEKNISFAVNGKTYTNVIHTRIDHQMIFMGVTTTGVYYDFYFAKGIGIIQWSYTANNVLMGSRKLVSYTVK